VCILSRRSIDDGNEQEEEEEEGSEEEEALNQLVISFRESHNSASYLSLHGIKLHRDKANKKRKINRPLSLSLIQVILVG
jgi:hypothetical protein